MKTEAATPPPEHGEAQNGGRSHGSHPFFKNLLNQGDLQTVTKVVEDLAKTERNFVLEKGQTTVELEKSRVEKESSVNLLEKVGGVIEKLQPSKK